MIGTNTLYSFQTFSGITGATAFKPGSVTITPFGTTTDFGIIVRARATASGLQLFDTLINYQISGNRFTSDTITLAGASTTNDGAVTDIQNYCGNGTFGPDGVSGCAGTNGTLLVLGNGSDAAAFTNTISKLDITHDFTLDPGLKGSATGGTITDRFTASVASSSVPEPGTYVLMSLGLALVAFRKVRVTVSDSKSN